MGVCRPGLAVVAALEALGAVNRQWKGRRLVQERRLDVLAFAPHQDDIEVGCAGILIRLRRLGYQVGIADMTASEMGTRGNSETRMAECTAAASAMDIDYRVNLGLPDGSISASPEADDKIIRTIRATRPALVLVPYPEDRHPDHVAAGLIVPAALFRAGLKKWDTGQAHHRPLSVVYYMLHDTFTPSLVVDVTEEWPTKMAALRCYKTQFAVSGAPTDEESTYVSSPEFLERLEARGRYFGSKIAARYGEPLFTREVVRVDDPMTLVNGSIEQYGSTHEDDRPRG
jgi:N-acetylglucosamine malate deacetylase 1